MFRTPPSTYPAAYNGEREGGATSTKILMLNLELRVNKYFSKYANNGEKNVS